MGDISSTLPAGSNVPAASPRAVLQVLDGVHVGVTLPLEKNVYSIGSKPTVDIMLGDHGVAPQHGVVSIEGSLVIIEATGGDIGLGKHHRIQHGRGCRTKLPVELTLGSAVLRIAREPGSSRSWLRSRPALRVAAIGGIGGIGLITLLGVDTDTGAGTGHVSVASLQQLAVVAAGPSPDTTASVSSPSDATAASKRPRRAPPVAPETVIETLSAKLRAAGLGEIVTTIEGTRLVASGTILHEQRSAWADIQRWFDLSYGGRYILASTVEVRAPSGNPKFDLQAISFSDTPYVITADGQRRYPGAVLDKGWVIKEIAARRLTLTKDGKELALSF
jgi:Inner membrane component of T3SS, cytoplasmic domain/Inner membrane component of T3SS, periplasmic domain